MLPAHGWGSTQRRKKHRAQPHACPCLSPVLMQPPIGRPPGLTFAKPGPCRKTGRHHLFGLKPSIFRPRAALPEPPAPRAITFPPPRANSGGLNPTAKRRRVADDRTPRGPATAPSSEELLRLVVESATDVAIIAMDQDGTVTSWNIGATRLLGYSDDEILHRDGDVIFTPEDRAARAPARERALAAENGRA